MFIQLDRAFKTIIALQKGVTAVELAQILEVSTKPEIDEDERRRQFRTFAMRYINTASLYLPVMETGKRRNAGCLCGPKATIYGLMED